MTLVMVGYTYLNLSHNFHIGFWTNWCNNF